MMQKGITCGLSALAIAVALTVGGMGSASADDSTPPLDSSPPSGTWSTSDPTAQNGVGLTGEGLSRPGAADTSDSPLIGMPPTYRYALVNVSPSYDRVNMSNVVGQCTTSKGHSCSVAKTTSATRTVAVDLGMSRNDVSAKLGISNATTQSTTVSCTLNATKSPQTLKVYPKGTVWNYKIQRKLYQNGVYVNTATSGFRSAFNPTRNAFYCAIS